MTGAEKRRTSGLAGTGAPRAYERDTQPGIPRRTAAELAGLQRHAANRANGGLIQRLLGFSAHPRAVNSCQASADDIAAIQRLQGLAGNQALRKALKADDISPHETWVTAAGGPAEAQAESVANGAAATVTPVTADGGAVPPDSVRALLQRPRLGGRPLPAETRADLEHRLGHDLGGIRLHTGPRARDAAEALGANALTVGTDIFLGHDVDAGSAAGRRLLAHEATHAVQQRGAPTHIQLDRKVAVKKHTITQITFFVDRDYVVLELDHKTTITLPAVYNGHPPAGTYRIEHGTATPPIGGVANARHFIVEWTDPPGTKLTNASSYVFTVEPGRPGPGPGKGPATGATEEGARKGDADKPGTEKGGTEKGGGAKDAGGIGGGTQGQGQADTGKGAGSVTSDQAGAGTTLGGAGDEAAERLSEPEEVVWREIAQLMKGARGAAPTESPAEIVRLFKVLRAMVVDPKFGTAGESWIKFAHFLDQNKDNIEGYFRSEKGGGKVTTAILQKLISEYGIFLASTKDQEGPAELKTDEDFDKEFKYDPGWRHLPPADRKLLLDYSRAVGGPASDKKIEFFKVGTGPKVGMALRLADTSLLGEVAEAAKAAVSDPRFVVTLVVTMGIYVGLWLTPDPSAVTKVAAAALTAYMLTQFTIQDIYGFAKAWSDLADSCAKATTVPELKAAGGAFFKRIGPIGFDIMMFIAMWRIGKLAGPKLSKIGAEMGVERAQGRLAAAQAEPGSGATPIAEPGPSPVAQARAAAGAGATPTQILDALAQRLPEAARDSLKQFRAKVPDSKVLAAVEGSKAPVRLLIEKAMSPEQVRAARAKATQAQFDLARAKLVAAETIKDPALRATVRTEQAQAIRALLKEAGTWDTPEFQDAFLRGDIGALGRMLRQVAQNVREAARNARSTETQGALGESVQRAILRTQYAGRKGVRFLSNLAVMRRLPDFDSIGDWARAERARIKADEPGMSAKDLESRVRRGVAKIFQKDGHLYEAIGEIDTMVVEMRPDGRFGILEMAEAKAGGQASPGSAMEQLARILAELRRIGDKASTAQVFELQGKRGLGEDITRKLAVDTLQQEPAMRTFGPTGDKAWDVMLGYTDAEFKAMAESLLRNLPPDEPPTARPPTAPRKKEEEAEAR